MSQNGNRAGFTIVELMAAVVAAAVLALAAGSLLLHTYRQWMTNAGVVEMQRDGTFAMSLLSRTVREAAPSSVSCSTGQLVAGTNSFYTNGNDLVYDPDTGTAGNEMVLVSGRLSAFLPTLLPAEGVEIDLQLREQGSPTRGSFQR